MDVYRPIDPVSRKVLRNVANDYHHWVAHNAQEWASRWCAPEGHRDDFVEQYFQQAQPDQVVAIIKAREPAVILTATGAGNYWHLGRQVPLGRLVFGTLPKICFAGGMTSFLLTRGRALPCRCLKRAYQWDARGGLKNVRKL